MMYIEDCLRALAEFMEAPNDQLKRRVYNVTAMSFTPEELVTELAKYVPELRVSYNPDSRQKIGKYFFLFSILNEKNFQNDEKKKNKYSHITADSWPQVFDDSEARIDWDWKPKYDLKKLVEFMVRDVSQNYIQK